MKTKRVSKVSYFHVVHYIDHDGNYEVLGSTPSRELAISLYRSSKEHLDDVVILVKSQSLSILFD